MKILLIVTIIWTGIACNAPQHKESKTIPKMEQIALPADWKHINECSIGYSIPPDLEEKKTYYVVHSLGGCIKAYGSKNIWLNVVPTKMLGDSSEYSNQRDFQHEQTEIDGEQAEIFIFTGVDMVNEATGKEYVAVLNVSRKHKASESLKMWAYSESPEDRETVIKIFKSVHFLKGQ